MSGTTEGAESVCRAAALDQLSRILDRSEPVDSLGELIRAIRSPADQQVDLGQSAVGLDSNVFLRLSGHAKAADMIDYFSTRHEAPLIVPGQTVQEFWNSRIAVVDTVHSSIRKKFDALTQELLKIDSSFGDFGTRIGGLLDEFSREYGHLYDEATLRRTTALLDVLLSKAAVTYVPRTLFRDIAADRRRTKTPPGFKDDADGDFFVWADFLLGLLLARANGFQFTSVVLVTQDAKLDWSREGVAHPLLAAEVRAAVDATFHVWTLEGLQTAVARLTQ